MSKKNKMDIITTYIIPLSLGGLLMWYTARMTDKFQKQSTGNQETIKAIADDISKVVDEINLKNDKIESNINENINISKQLSDILGKVNDLTEKTNLIASDIKNEQKVKGNLSLILPKKESYQVEIGGAGNQFYYSRNELQKEEGFNAITSKNTNTPILNLKLRNEEFLVTTKLYDFTGNVVTEINENKWAVGSNIFSKNWNKDALEIIDNRGNVALQINLKDDKIIIRGIIPTSSGIMILTDEDFITLDFNDAELSSKLHNYSKKINRIFEHTGSDYLGSKLPLTKEETENIAKVNKYKNQINNRFNKLKKLDSESVINEVTKHVKGFRALLYESELNQSKIDNDTNTPMLSSNDLWHLKTKKRKSFQENCFQIILNYIKLNLLQFIIY